MKKTILVVSIFISVAMVSCLKSKTETNLIPILPENPYDYLTIKRQDNVQHLSNLINDESKKSITNQSVVLGRVLFYDKNLSINNTVSCGSCHIQSLAFSDGVALSKGFKNVKTPRNSMAIVNPVLNNNMFWDSR